MKSWIILIVVAVATTVTASVAFPLLSERSAPLVSGPKLVAAPVEISENAPQAEVTSPLAHDFGVMAQETQGNYGWIFKNNGKETLELRNMGTDCSCTIAQIGKEGSAGDGKTMLPVAPGQEERVELTWNTRQINGGYHKSAKIGTNDPRQPVITLSVEGKVYPAVVVIPGDMVVSFQTISNDEDVHRTAYIYSKNRPEIKITDIVNSNPRVLTVDPRPMTSDELAAMDLKAGLALDMTLKPSNELGSFAYEVLVQLDHPDKDKVRFKVTGRVTGPVTFMPERAVIHDATSADGGSKDLIVWIRGRSGTKISTEKTPPGVEVDFTPMPQPANVAGTKYRMKVRVLPGTSAGQIVDEIVLKTDHPMASQIRVPIDALVQGN